MEVQGCVAIVTGANRGIGEGFVHVLIAEGAARVYAGARDPASAKHLEDAYPGKVTAVRLDVSKPDQITAAAAACPDVSVVVNNAGVSTGQLLIGADDMSAMREEMEVNYFGPVAMARAFAPALKANGGGAILNVLSVAGIVAVPNMGGYSPSKFAMRAADRSSAPISSWLLKAPALLITTDTSGQAPAAAVICSGFDTSSATATTRPGNSSSRCPAEAGSRAPA